MNLPECVQVGKSMPVLVVIFFSFKTPFLFFYIWYRILRIVRENIHTLKSLQFTRLKCTTLTTHKENLRVIGGIVQLDTGAYGMLVMVHTWVDASTAGMKL